MNSDRHLSDVTHYFSCVIIGEQSLLIRCSEMVLSLGHKIHLIVTADDSIKQWCKEHQLETRRPNDDWAKLARELEFDYLFSITNLAIIPDPILQLPRRDAINFHDGPLPRFAGLNTPAWALIEGEKEYGITWHMMSSKVDRGDILKQKLFPIDDNDTAFSLNAKCYEAGMEAFTDLVGELAKKQETRTPIRDKGRYFEWVKRPDAASVIDWYQPAAAVSALVRALDFGPYFNPLGLVKINLGGQLLIAKSAQMGSGVEDSSPGTILSVADDSVTVACSDQAITLGNITSLYGTPVDIKQEFDALQLKQGNILPSLSKQSILAINAVNKEICRFEPYWVKQLKNLTPIESPYCLQFGDPSTQKTRYAVKHYHLPTPVLKNRMYQEFPTEFMLAAIALLLSRLAGCVDEFDLSFSSYRLHEKLKNTENLFSSWVPLHVKIDHARAFPDLLDTIKAQERLLNSKTTFTRDLCARDALLLGASKCEDFQIACELTEDINTYSPSTDDTFKLLFVLAENGHGLALHYNQQALLPNAAEQLLEQLNVLLLEIITNTNTRVAEFSIITVADKQLLFTDWIPAPVPHDQPICIHELFQQQAAISPSDIALNFEGVEFTYAELNENANRLARLLMEYGAVSGDRIGILVDRSLEMVVALFAVLKAGCAYVPLDPLYPRDRLIYMVDDAKCRIVLTQRQHFTLLPNCSAHLISLEDSQPRLAQLDKGNLDHTVPDNALAYVIYTSGSTGKPKGVMVEHKNVVNFFKGMDERIGTEKGVWLAATSISFDISVLELFWTLSRGFKVILHADSVRQQSGSLAEHASYSHKPMDFSLFYWNVVADESEYDKEKYRLLLESAVYGDKNGFSAVWTPERHFNAFGGLYPNPSITSAALATITANVSLRAGSCVVPLHSPVRIAEEWSVIDNLSNGRVGISIASGWAPPDFAIKPENFADAKNIMFESAEIVRKLWRGETVEMPGPQKTIKVRTLPRPIQKELPIWVTTAGNIDTYLKAAEIGANILTHLLGQSIEEVGEKLTVYRKAWKEHGHPGEGHVTLMLHTFVGNDADQIMQHVRGPMKNYLKSAMFLVKSAAWQFPTFKAFSEEQGKTLDDFFDTISDEDLEALLEFAFQRYYGTSGLFGTPETCMEIVNNLKKIGVNEIACLIDFGVLTDVVLEHLPYLNTLRERANQESTLASEKEQQFSIPALIKRHHVTHFQCTPSMAMMLSVDAEAKKSLTQIKQLLVGGEAFPPEIANELRDLVSGRVCNMYGPTETTVWSSTHELDESYKRTVSIGMPIANTQIYVLDRHMQPMPVGVPGEVVIGGDGVVRGYFGRDEITAERFVQDPFHRGNNARLYKTGDLGRYRSDGQLECLGRLDHQIKIRGYRVELGEIETVLREHDSVMECAVIIREDKPGDQRLVAYIQPTIGQVVVPTILRKHMETILPEFMVPALFVSLDRLPLTPNRKIDRKALPEPSSRIAHTEESVLPNTEAEKFLVDLWKQALGSEGISIWDNFFEAGGHSLLAAQVVAQVKKDTGIRIPLASMVINTLEQIAAKYLPSGWNAQLSMDEIAAEQSGVAVGDNSERPAGKIYNFLRRFKLGK